MEGGSSSSLTVDRTLKWFINNYIPGVPKRDVRQTITQRSLPRGVLPCQEVEGWPSNMPLKFMSEPQNLPPKIQVTLTIDFAFLKFRYDVKIVGFCPSFASSGIRTSQVFRFI